MAVSFDPDIDAAVRLWNAKPNQDVPDPHAAAIAQLRSNAPLVEKMRAEIRRLEDTSGPRALLHPNRPDYVSLQLHRNLTDMLAVLGS